MVPNNWQIEGLKIAKSVFGWIAVEVLGKNIEEFQWIYKQDQEGVALLSGAMMASENKKSSYKPKLYKARFSNYH